MEYLPFVSYLMMNSDILIGSRYVDKFGSHKSRNRQMSGLDMSKKW